MVTQEMEGIEEQQRLLHQALEFKPVERDFNFRLKKQKAPTQPRSAVASASQKRTGNEIHENDSSAITFERPRHGLLTEKSLDRAFKERVGGMSSHFGEEGK